MPVPKFSRGLVPRLRGPQPILYRVLAALAVSTLIVGCDIYPNAYMGGVRAHIPDQPVNALREAVLSIGGFEPVKEVQGGDPRCRYYHKRLVRSGVPVSVSECAGPTAESRTGWSYSFTVHTLTEGNRPEIRGEIDQLLENIRSVIQERVGDAKVNKGSGGLDVRF